MQLFNLGLLVLAVSVLILGLFSNRFKTIGVPDSAILLVLGVVLGPVGLGWFVPDEWGNAMAALEQLARLSLAIGLMGVALRLPKTYVAKHWRALVLVLGMGMPVMWLIGSVLIASILGVSVITALIIGAVVTPTDPVVASSLVTGPVAQRALPAYLRQIISAESGANDGLAFLFVLSACFPLLLAPGESFTLHVLGVLTGDVLSAIVLGVAIGYGAGLALLKAEKNKLIEHSSILTFTTALALGTLAAVELVGSNGILAVFVAGLAFDQQVDVSQRHEEEYVVAGFDRFFTSPVFFILGLMIPWHEWHALGGPAVILIIAILFLRRLPLFILLARRTRDLPTLTDGAFIGWFGPIGVAALYYAAFVHKKLALPELWPVVSLLVASSILIHGLSAVPLSHLYRYLRHRNIARSR